jgi:hypothetical protein
MAGIANKRVLVPYNDDKKLSHVSPVTPASRASLGTPTRAQVQRCY